ncbi:MAG: hypothetical protein HS130_07715 [Deltaproteobacteria bacterium]|nr:hypothetical protein [Deltaproteobacteria bacterium]MCL4873102.1 hypothetical protein [bacterium]
MPKKKKEKTALEITRETILEILYAHFKKEPTKPLAGITIEEESGIPYDELKWNLEYLKSARYISFEYIEDYDYPLRPVKITVKGIEFIEKIISAR